MGASTKKLGLFSRLRKSRSAWETGPSPAMRSKTTMRGRVRSAFSQANTARIASAVLSFRTSGVPSMEKG